MKKTLIFIIWCVIGLHTFAQNEASNWLFGENAGIKFNVSENRIFPILSGQLNTREGCASISDELGALLFYSDGTTIWNKNHEIMVNGEGLFGDASSTQSAIIVPKPGDPNIYYVFTVDDISFEGEKRGLNYSTVDMSLDGGLGAVTQKNTSVLAKSSEKLTAVLKDCETESMWVLTFASEDGTQEIFNTFHAFEISSAGVNINSIKSTFSSIIPEGRGYLKLSPDGTTLVAAMVKSGLYLYDFDASSGIVSNQRNLTINSSSNFPYGVEFSPNSKLLYVHSSNDFFDQDLGNPLHHFSTLTQFDLSQSIIQNTEITIDQRQLYRGALQLGPDGKIYRALSSTYNDGLPFLGVIENPNVAGIGCNYNHNGVDLGFKRSSQGLPPFISSFFNSEIDIIKNNESNISLSLCDGDIYTLRADEIPGATYEWSIDGNPLPENSFELDITVGGDYKVVVTVSSESCPFEGKAFVRFYPFPDSITHTMLQCDEDGLLDGLTVFNLTEAKTIFTGSLDYLSTKYYTDASRTNEITDELFYNTQSPQTVYVEVTNDLSGCSGISELILDVSNTNINNVVLPPVCDDDGVEDGYYTFNLKDADAFILSSLPPGSEVNYYISQNDAILEQNILDASFTNTEQNTQVIYARAENGGDCYGIGEVLLTINPLPDIETEFLDYYCINKFPETITLDAGIRFGSLSNYTYNWSTEETSSEIEINSPGIYTVDVTNANGCSKQRTITVETSNIASFNTPPYEVKDISTNNSVTVLVSGEGIYQFALYDEKTGNLYRGFQDSNAFENVYPGIYSIKVRDTKKDCGTVDIPVSIVGFPKFFTPNNDGINDTWQVLGVSSMFQPNTKIHIYDRYGKLLKQISPTDIGWSGILNGQVLPADDYWFSVRLEDGRIFKNHFTLKN